MHEDWKEWVSEELIQKCRKDLVKAVVPQVTKKKGDKRGGHNKKIDLGKMGRADRNQVRACTRSDVEEIETHSTHYQSSKISSHISFDW